MFIFTVCVHIAIFTYLYNSFFSYPDAYFEELQPLFIIDPYLLRLLILKTDINCLSSLFEKVPISILIMRLVRESLHGIKVSNTIMHMNSFYYTVLCGECFYI